MDQYGTRKNTMEDFPLGCKVRIVASFIQELNGSTGTVTEKWKSTCRIHVDLDVPVMIGDNPFGDIPTKDLWFIPEELMFIRNGTRFDLMEVDESTVERPTIILPHIITDFSIGSEVMIIDTPFGLKGKRGTVIEVDPKMDSILVEFNEPYMHVRGNIEDFWFSPEELMFIKNKTRFDLMDI